MQLVVTHSFKNNDFYQSGLKSAHSWKFSRAKENVFIYIYTQDNRVYIMPERFCRSLFLCRDYILIFKSNAPYHFSRSMESACVTVQNPERFLASFQLVNVRFSNQNINFLLLNLQKIYISLEEK